MGLSDEIMKEVKRYDDGNGCTRRQLVDNILILVQQSNAATTPPAVTEPWRDEGGHAWEVRHNVTCVECPHCCFIFAAVHTDGYSSGYSCPNCEGCPDAVTKAGEDDPES